MTSTQMRADRDAPSVADVLDRAADLITPEGVWIQGDFAETESGEGVYGFHSQAVCFCAIGAVQHVWGGFAPDKVLRVIGRVVPDMAHYNDQRGRTQSEVVARLRDAANYAREQGL